MAKEKDTQVTEREQLWQELLAKYEKENPVKFAQKKARGEFDKIPVGFIGKKIIKNGREMIV